MVRRVISTIMVFLLSVIKGGAWLGLHLLLVVLEILGGRKNILQRTDRYTGKYG